MLFVLPVSSHCGDRKKQGYWFFQFKNCIFNPIFYPKHLQNIIKNLINQFMALKTQRIVLKPKINLKYKNFTKMICVFLGNFKVKKKKP